MIVSVPVDEILHFLYGHRHHLFEYFETNWSPAGQLTYGKVPSLLYNSIVMFAYNYQKQIWCIADDTEAYELCQDWSRIVFSKSTEIHKDSFLSRKDFFNIVKLLQKDEIGITEIQLTRTFDPTTHDSLSHNSPPPEINSSPPLHSKRKLQPFDAIVSDKDHPKKGGDADPGAEVFISERQGASETVPLVQPKSRRSDRHDQISYDHTSKFRPAMSVDGGAPKRRHQVGAQVRHKHDPGQVSVSAGIDRSKDKIKRNTYESRSICDAMFAAGFDPYVDVTFAPFRRDGPTPHLNIKKKSNAVYNVERACQWQKRDANVMKFGIKIAELKKSGLRFCIYDEEVGFSLLDQRLGGAIIRVGEHITQVMQEEEKPKEIELVMRRRKKFSGILKVHLCAKRSKDVPKDECVLKVEVDTATAMKKDRGDDANVDGSTALLSVIVFVVYLAIVGYIFQVLEADAVGSRIKTWSDGFWFSFITATTVGYGDFYPVSDIGLYVNCFVMLMDVLFLGFVISIAFEYVVGTLERRSRINAETGGRDPLSDLSFYEYLYFSDSSAAGAPEYWNSERRRKDKERRKKIKAFDVGGRKVFVDGDFSDIKMEDFDVTAHIEKKGGMIVSELADDVDVCIIGEKKKRLRFRKEAKKKENQLRKEAKEKKISQIWDSIDFRYWHENYREETWIEEKIQEYFQIILFTCITIGFVFVGGFVWMFAEDMKIDEAVHFCFVSMSTVGYGDIAPISRSGMWFCAFYILTGVGVLARLGSLLTDSIVEKQSEKVTQKIADEMLMHESQLQEMDMDGKGKVDRYEFMRGLLLAMGKARHADFMGIEERFRDIDEDGGGTINKEDFDLMLAKRKKAKEDEHQSLSIDDAFTPGSEPTMGTTE